MSNDNITIQTKNLGDDYNDERIDAYLRDEMTADEKEAFIKELDSDDELRQKAVVRARIVIAMDDMGSKTDAEVIEVMKHATEESIWRMMRKHYFIEQEVSYYKLSGSDYERMMEEEAPEEEAPKQKASEHAVQPVQKKSRIIPLRILSVACTIIAIVWLGYLSYGRYSTVKLGEDYATAITTESDIMRGGAEHDKVAEELKTLFGKVTAGDDIEDDIEKLDMLWTASLSTRYNDYTDYSPEIGWHLAIACLKDNDREKAATVLHRLIATTEQGSLINTKARELLEKME